MGLGTPAFIRDPEFIQDPAFNRSFAVPLSYLAYIHTQAVFNEHLWSSGLFCTFCNITHTNLFLPFSLFCHSLVNTDMIFLKRLLKWWL